MNSKAFSTEDYTAAVEKLLWRCRNEPKILELVQEINHIVQFEHDNQVCLNNRFLSRILGQVLYPLRKIAIISDIHGNYEGLMATFDDIEQQSCDHIVCLGDLVEGGMENEKVIETLQERSVFCVRGNHDEINDLNLSYNTRQFLAELPEYIILEDMLFIHISPREKKYKIDHVVEAWNVFEESTYRLIYVGHSHIPLVFGKRSKNYGEAHQHFFEYNKPLQLEKDDRYIINVGAIGYGRDLIGKIRYGIFDAESETIEIRAIAGPLLPLDYSLNAGVAYF